MSNNFIIYNDRPADQVRGPRPAGASEQGKVYPMTPGLWLRETQDTIDMYGPKEGGFSPVQLSLFPDLAPAVSVAPSGPNAAAVSAVACTWSNEDKGAGTSAMSTRIWRSTSVWSRTPEMPNSAR